MSATFKYQSLDIKSIGKSVTIPNNDIARLMYYLSCVDTVIRHDDTDKFSDYEHYYRLTKADEDILLGLVVIFNPKIFINAGIFIVDQKLIPYGFDNEFYQITDQKIGIHVNQEVIIGGKSVKVLKIMACNTAWLNRFYIQPIENITNSRKNRYLPEAPKYSSSNYSSNNYSSNNYSSNNYSSNNYSPSNYSSNENSCCKRFWQILIVIIVIGILYYFIFEKK